MMLMMVQKNQPVAAKTIYNHGSSTMDVLISNGETIITGSAETIKAFCIAGLAACEELLGPSNEQRLTVKEWLETKMAHGPGCRCPECIPVQLAATEPECDCNGCLWGDPECPGKCPCQPCLVKLEKGTKRLGVA